MTDNIYEKLSEERKDLQAKGLVPEWYSTGGYQMFKNKYEYQTEGRSVRGQFERIARTAASHLKGTLYEHNAYNEFFTLLWKGWLSPSTPVLANMGTDRGMPVSCSATIVDDSIDGFYSNLREVALLTKHGFGTASDFSNIRPRGSNITIGGKANGVVPVIREHINTMVNVSQGTSRRGAWAVYLNIEHGDFWEVNDYLLSEPDDFNIGWKIHDTFVERLNNQDPEAILRFQAVMKTKMVTGKGYFFFPDKANRNRPEAYVKNNLFVNCSNLCVAPETLILTDVGHVRISDLENETVNVWNGQEFSSVKVVKTGSNQKLLTVKTDSGYQLDCTPYHKFYVVNPVTRKIVEKRAHELNEGDKLIKSNFPIIDGSNKLEYAYENGLFSAEGCYTKNGSRIYFYHEKRKLLDHVDRSIFKTWYTQDNQNREYGESDKLMPKFFVPLDGYSVESKIRWLEGLLDGDGTVCTNVRTQNIQLGNVNLEFLQDVQMMLQTLGVSSKITKNADAGYRLLPANDGTGEMKEFYCQDTYRLMFGNTAINTLQNLGFKPKRLVISNHVPNRDCSHFVKVTGVVDSGRIDDTYCFTEPLRGMGVFNGILTGQCSEIMLFNDAEHTYTCVLASMNVAKYDEWKDTDAVFWATVFLDCVAQEFITRARNVPGLEKAVRFTEKGRALGLGQCGLHTYMMRKGIPFESFEAHMLSSDIAEHIKVQAEEASKDMSIILGEPEWCKGLNRRNTHLIAIAPTKSTALIMGGISEGINPDPAMTYTQLTAAGEVDRVNVVLLELMKAKGVYTDANIQQIVDKQGSVQHVDWLTDEEKKVFKTSFEMNQQSIVRMAAARGKYIDQWQSLNLSFSESENPEWIAQVHKEAFLNEKILALYYVQMKAGVQASKDCEACQ